MPTTTVIPDRRAPRRITSGAGFVLVLVAVTTFMAGASAPSPFYPVLQEQMGFSPAMLTVVFAIYAVMLLLTLLVTGSLSDHVGRRPVVSAGLLVLGLSMLGLWQADTVGALVAARALQGIAAGLLLSSLSAYVVDLEPPDRPGSAPVLNTVLPLGGLAVGALGAGVVLDRVGPAGAVVFGSLALLYVVLAVLVLAVPETSPRTAGWARSLVPRVGVPAPARAPFLRALPALVAGWATGGLYLSLAAPLVEAELGGSSATSQGLVVATLVGVGAVACFVARDWTPRRTSIVGATALAVGTALTLGALVVGSLPAFLAAELVAGFGFGTAFLGVMRSVTPTVGPDQRGELFAAVFVVSYVAFGIPAVLAGVAVPHVGLATTTEVYGSAVVVLAATAALLRRFGTAD